MSTQSWIEEHTDELTRALRWLGDQSGLVERWGAELADRLVAGHRVLVAGNGGSAAEAQHLTSELVGRFLAERRPFSALSLCAESSSVTAIVNDYGADEMFARQVEAHGRPGDVLVLLSTSGRSPNILRAAERGQALGLRVWALSGAAPNPLVGCSHEALAVPAPSTAAVQAAHLVAIHALCAAFDARVGQHDAGLVDAHAPAPASEVTPPPERPAEPGMPALALDRRSLDGALAARVSDARRSGAHAAQHRAAVPHPDDPGTARAAEARTAENRTADARALDGTGARA